MIADTGGHSVTEQYIMAERDSLFLPFLSQIDVMICCPRCFLHSANTESITRFQCITEKPLGWNVMAAVSGCC